MSFPKYSFSDELPAPSDLGIRREGSFEALKDSLAGANFYVDAIAFGAPTMFAKQVGGSFTENQRPLGVQFFKNTGLQCSNGAPMHEYVSTIPKGDALGKSVQNMLSSRGLPAMRGIAPGIVEDVKDTLNPDAFFMVAGSTGFPACKKVRLPVGDSKNQIKSSYDPNNVWIEEPVDWIAGKPTQERWIFDKWISKEAWDAIPKTQAPKLQSEKVKVNKPGETECFTNQQGNSQVYAGVLFAIISLGILYYAKLK